MMDNLMTADAVQQHFTAALKDMPVPVSQPPGDAEATTWLTFPLPLHAQRIRAEGGAL